MWKPAWRNNTSLLCRDLTYWRHYIALALNPDTFLIARADLKPRDAIRKKKSAIVLSFIGDPYSVVAEDRRCFSFELILRERLLGRRH